jgi:hypothetical protein
MQALHNWYGQYPQNITNVDSNISAEEYRHVLNGGKYKMKYLKYKQKYLELKKKLENNKL